MSDWPFGHLRQFGYGGIIADPPWQYEMYSAKGYKKSPEAHYETMPDDEILNLPVGHLAQSSCWLLLWAIGPKLPLAIKCMETWGFRYITMGAWVKRTKNGKLRWGTGYNVRSCTEPFLLGRIGEVQIRITDMPNVIEARARQHSRKPKEARVMIERMTPRSWRCELFSREPWPGNDVWGKEANKFNHLEEEAACHSPSTASIDHRSRSLLASQESCAKPSTELPELEGSQHQLTFGNF